MLSPAEILDERCVLFDIDAKRKKQVVEALVGSLGDIGVIDDPRRISRLVLDRERKASTGIGHGVAIPHWLSAEIPRTVMAFARTRRGVSYSAIDGRPVQLFFLILGSSDNPNEHLQLLSTMSRILSQ